jgi:hypothetical protein
MRTQARDRARVLVLITLFAGSTVLLPGAGEASPAVAPASRAYASELDAVIAASSASNPQSIREDREFLGAIFRHGDDFHYSVAPGHVGADRIQARLAVPAGYELVAFWHTHGAAAPARRYFSATDTALVSVTGKPLYLADFSGALRILKPGAPTLSRLAALRLGLGHGAGTAKGERLRGPEGALVHIPTRADPVLAITVSN